MNIQEFLRMRQDMLPDDSRPEIIRTYAEMRATVSEIISGSLGSVLLLGMPGNGKTTLFEEVEQKHLADGIEPPLSILNNYVTAAGLFQWAKANRGKLLLLDDVREIFRQKQNIATLMALADTKPVTPTIWRS